MMQPRSWPRRVASLTAAAVAGSLNDSAGAAPAPSPALGLPVYSQMLSREPSAIWVQLSAQPEWMSITRSIVSPWPPEAVGISRAASDVPLHALGPPGLGASTSPNNAALLSSPPDEAIPDDDTRARD